MEAAFASEGAGGGGSLTSQGSDRRRQSYQRKFFWKSPLYCISYCNIYCNTYKRVTLYLSNNIYNGLRILRSLLWILRRLLWILRWRHWILRCFICPNNTQIAPIVYCCGIIPMTPLFVYHERGEDDTQIELYIIYGTHFSGVYHKWGGKIHGGKIHGGKFFRRKIFRRKFYGGKFLEGNS